MTIRLASLADRLGQTTITIPIDLGLVERLGPGEEIVLPGDTQPEVYVVTRFGADHVSVRSISVGADGLRISAYNYPPENDPDERRAKEREG